MGDLWRGAVAARRADARRSRTWRVLRLALGVLRGGRGDLLLGRRRRRAHRLPESAQRLTQATAGLGEALGAEHDERDHADDHEMHWAEKTFEHGTAPNRVTSTRYRAPAAGPCSRRAVTGPSRGQRRPAAD